MDARRRLTGTAGAQVPPWVVQRLRDMLGSRPTRGPGAATSEAVSSLAHLRVSCLSTVDATYDNGEIVNLRPAVARTGAAVRCGGSARAKQGYQKDAIPRNSPKGIETRIISEEGDQAILRRARGKMID